ncbi:cupin domain-containing protein [Calditerrivibrio sp.]|jgi:mannose-6-phosphate isomerase-like protein (cupin superfamily)|uniref:cupin domain-containing protein n=1 Tax=Calditerrivibrio sp. TaxID=2792612 RepID=UPI003D0B75C5
MIIRGNEIAEKIVEKPRDGRGTLINLAYEKACGIQGTIKMFSVVTLNSDSMVGYHQHVDDMEIYLMLDGTAVVNDNGTVDLLKSGDMLVTNFGEWHSIENKSADPITFMAIIIDKIK